MFKSAVLVVVTVFLVGFAFGEDAPIVTTTKGKVKGTKMTSSWGNKFNAYVGIRYGKATTGDRRFKAPEPADPWTGILDATKECSMCPQHGLMGYNGTVGDEDCLCINVFTPDVNPAPAPRVVMVWIYGGGFQTGFAALGSYGPQILMNRNIILVDFNYRVGALGFMSTGDDNASGNYGLKDQNLALRWVKENIASFGGDPNKVTIFGESAGSASVSYHVMSPMSKGLFRGAISQSGNVLGPWARTRKPLDFCKLLAHNMGCTEQDTPEYYVSCLRTKDALLIQETADNFSLPVKMNFPNFGPVIESWDQSENSFMPDLPLKLLESGNFNKVPFITGYNLDELILLISMLKKPPALDVFNANIRVSLPAALFYAYLKDEDLKNSITDQVIEKFLGGRSKIDDENIYNFTQTANDRAFRMPASGFLRVLNKVAKDIPTYLYHMTWRGNESAVPSAAGIVDYWVSHGDDLQFLFPGSPFKNSPFHPGEPEFLFSKFMVDMWTNFAETGNPNEGVNPIPLVTWDQFNYDQYNYLNLSWPHPAMKSDIPLRDRFTFWNQLWDYDLKDK